MQRIRWSQKRIAGSEEIERIACFELAEFGEFGEFGEFAGLGELDGFNEFDECDEYDECDECDECDERGNRRKGWEDGARRNVAGIGFLAEAKRAVDSKYAESVGGIGGIQGIDVSDSLDGDFRRMEIWCVAVCLNYDGKNWRLYVWDVH